MSDTDPDDELTTLRNVAVTAGEERRSNNERVRLYATSDGETPYTSSDVSDEDIERYGVIRHDYEDGHAVRLRHPHDGDVPVVDLHTTNKRRVRG